MPVEEKQSLGVCVCVCVLTRALKPRHYAILLQHLYVLGKHNGINCISLLYQASEF